MIQPEFEKTFAGWRSAARHYLQFSVPPEQIEWDSATASLFSQMPSPSPLPYDEAVSNESTSPSRESSPPLCVPADFLEVAKSVCYARDEDRWDLLYRILFRIQHENPHLFKICVDPDILRAQLLSKAVRRDIHKMHAFVRFKQTQIESHEFYVAWHKSEHLVVKPATPFFARRFGDRRWSIYTPDESAHWDLNHLTFGPGMNQNEFSAREDWRDPWEEVWKTYYKSIFNPARIKIKAMKLEMATKYWSSMPETTLIADLVRDAPRRLQEMAKNHNQAAIVDESLPLQDLRAQVQTCTACPLYAHATQAVFGVGPENAALMIIGEQPGDQEDLAGRPFIGPAGKVLEKALEQAKLSPTEIYLTNAVKHFKYIQTGKTRLHKTPNGAEMHACKPWLEAEIARVRPTVIVALGVTAATALLGRLPKISTERGLVFTDLPSAPAVILSWHPASILRSSDEKEAEQRREQLSQDLRLAGKTVGLLTKSATQPNSLPLTPKNRLI
jgi:probable DNA metabolism protein